MSDSFPDFIIFRQLPIIPISAWIEGRYLILLPRDSMYAIDEAMEKGKV